MDRNQLLYFNTPLKLAIVSYLLDGKFIENNYDKFSESLFKRNTSLDKLSSSEIKRIIQIYNPNFKAFHKHFNDILDNMVETKIVKKEKGTDLIEKYNGTGKFNKKANYFSVDDLNVQDLLRHILHTSIENGIDYQSMIHPWPSLNDRNNGIKFEIISVLSGKEMEIKELCDIVEGLELDTFYKNAIPLSNANLIHLPYEGKKEGNKQRIKRYTKTYKFKTEISNLDDIYKERAELINDNFCAGCEFTDKELYELFNDHFQNTNRKTVNSFRRKLTDLSMLKLSNPEILDKIYLTQKGYRAKFLIIDKINDFFNGENKIENLSYNETILREALNYRR